MREMQERRLLVCIYTAAAEIGMGQVAQFAGMGAGEGVGGVLATRDRCGR